METMSLRIPAEKGPAAPQSTRDPRLAANADADDTLQDGNHSDDSVFEDQNEDDAQAVLQPAMSAAASHLTSCQTPAIEKAAALENQPLTPYFNLSPVEKDMPPPDADGGDGDGDGDSDSTPEPLSSPDKTPRIGADSPKLGGETPMTAAESPRADGETAGAAAETAPKPQMSLGQLPPQRPSPQPPLPSPWHAGPRDLVIKDGRSRHTRNVIGTALEHAAHHRSRSRSAGQDALKRLSKAFPSLSTPTHLLPSLPSSLFSFADRSASSSPIPASRSSSTLVPQTPPGRMSRPPLHHSSRPPLSQSQRPPLKPRRSGSVTGSTTPSTPRPPMLRRVTSDDSVLYHNLSRQSSLEDDDHRFQDVREMVNMRLMALKDSLPEVPNFKMPSLAKLQAASKRSSLSLNTMFSNEASPAPTARAPLERGLSTGPRDDLTALDRVLEDLTGDIVILGGYRGSILRSAEPPHQQVWAPVKLGLNMRKVNLEVGLEEADEDAMEEHIIPSGMLKHIGPIDVTRKLFKKIRSCDNAKAGRLRVWDYGYDWRLSPALLSRKLQEFLQGLPSNKAGGGPEGTRGALVIAHSLGGLITRHAVNQRPDLFSGVLYAGAPQRCINILGPFRNGDVVLFNEKLLTAHVNFSIRTSFVFLPEDGFCFVDKHTGEQYPVDFYDPEQWVKWHLSPCVQPPLPPPARPHASSLSSLLPNSFRARGDSRSEKRPPPIDTAAAAASATPKDRTIAPQMHPGTAAPVSTDKAPTDPERQRYLAYLGRTLAATRKFRAELEHSPQHQATNAYPPLAVLYGRTIPTVYAAQVEGREAIPRADAYDDLLFRAGDGVVLAKEAMLPTGYHVVRGGRVHTERGHITMLGDMPAVGRALEALVRGRRKGIGSGKPRRAA